MEDRNLQAPWVGKTPEEYYEHNEEADTPEYKGVVDCKDCKYMYNCEKTYLGGCTDGEEWNGEGDI